VIKVALGNVCSIHSGGTPNRSIDSYWGGDIPWAKISDLEASGDGYISDAEEHISEEGLEAIRGRIFDDGTLLFAIYGSVGKAAIVRGAVSTNQAILGIKPDSSCLDLSYLKFWLRSQQSKFNQDAQGVAQKNLSAGYVRALEIPLPPLPEQKRIAAILDKADAIRRKRQQAIQLADDFLRAVFLEMFGSVIEGAANIVSFSDIAVLDAPMVDPRDEEYIDLIHIGPDRIEKKIGKLLPALTAREERLVSKKFLFDDRYVLYSKIRPYLRKCAMAEGVGLCSADMYPVRPVEGVATKEFLWMLLLSDFFTAYTESLPARANIPKLNREELGAFTLSLPDYSQQLKFSSIVRAANITGQRVMESAAYVDGAFESLSQKAFSGQL
jgi:type I restriction enzyme S subunit